jgi:hypothetical protein
LLYTWENCIGKARNTQKLISMKMSGREQNFEWFFPSKCEENSAEDSVGSDHSSAGRTKEKL